MSVLVVLTVALLVARIIANFWLWTWVFATWGSERFLKMSSNASQRQLGLWNCCMEARLAMLISMPLVMVIDIRSEHSLFVKTFFLVGDLFWFWVAYSNKDDRWKKRRAKLLAKVQEVSGKLVVVPVAVGK